MSLSGAEQEQLCQAALRFGCELPSEHLEALGRYVELLMLWRSHARLISQRQSRADILRKHVADAFSVLSHLSGRHRIADVGSGAGLPGIPIAIVRSDAHVALVEVNRRKANFLREVVRELRLANASVIEARAEDYATTTDARHYDAIVSRAVWSIADLLLRVGGLVADPGVVIAMKGPAVGVELAETNLAELGFRVRVLEPYALDSGERRVLVVLEPQRST